MTQDIKKQAVIEKDKLKQQQLQQPQSWNPMLNSMANIWQAQASSQMAWQV